MAAIATKGREQGCLGPLWEPSASGDKWQREGKRGDGARRWGEGRWK